MSLKDLLNIDFSTMDFNNHVSIRIALQHLLNLVEALYKENVSLKSQIQQLKDEINRLKGQKGKPDIKANSSDKNNKPDKYKFIQPKKSGRSDQNLIK